MLMSYKDVEESKMSSDYQIVIKNKEEVKEAKKADTGVWGGIGSDTRKSQFKKDININQMQAMWMSSDGSSEESGSDTEPSEIDDEIEVDSQNDDEEEGEEEMEDEVDLPQNVESPREFGLPDQPNGAFIVGDSSGVPFPQMGCFYEEKNSDDDFSFGLKNEGEQALNVVQEEHERLEDSLLEG